MSPGNVTERRLARRLACLLGLMIWLLAAILPAQEASAHPMDEYVQNTYIDLAPDRTTLQIDLTPGVLVAPEMVTLVDADGDGEISEAEGEAYAKNAVLGDVSLEVDGEPQPLTLVESSFPTPLDMGAGMGTIRLQLAAEAPAGSPGDHALSYRNVHEPVNSRYLVNAFEASGEIEISHQDHDELQNAIRVDYTTASDAPAASSGDDASTDAAGTGIPERQQRLVGYLRETTLSPWLLAAGLGLSALLGGLHALTPGHGKTLVAAYLVGSRGTVGHAAALGGIVTLTHTASVVGVGLLALLAGQYVVPEVLVPALEVCAGVLVVAMGARLVRTRYASRGDDHDDHHHEHGGHHHGHHHPHKDVRTGDLLAMGVSGGLVPCPEALGVMLVAVGLGKTALGLGLIAAFSFGLAAVLIAIGVLMVRARSGLLDRLGKRGRAWQRLLPLLSAVVVTLLGVGIALKGLMTYVG